ncbi:Guanylylate cyclase-domain-containing protein [Cunninghamella echinulata]|nr:Guanylylate cyclase-domain-containing protein [Cunninghamella echinulata]
MAILCCSTTEEDELVYDYEEYNRHIVPHLMQNNQWDCGLACVAMVLHSMNINTSLDELTRHCAVDSIWGIDLAYLLKNYVEDFTYYTSYFGSRKEYQDNQFYQEGFDQDEVRVNRLFSMAKSSSIHIVRM